MNPNGNQRMSGDAREKFLLRYTEALLCGDIETQEELALSAENDPELEDSLWELHLTVGVQLRSEAGAETALASETDAAVVRDLLASHFSANLLTHPQEATLFQAEEEIDFAQPITVREVAASLRTDMARNSGSVPRGQLTSMQGAIRVLEANAEVLPENLSLKGIRSLLARVGTNAGRWFEQQFHEAAVHLSLARTGNARLAAARRTRNVKPLQERSEESSRSLEDVHTTSYTEGKQEIEKETEEK